MAGIQLFKDVIHDSKNSLLIKINLGVTIVLLILMLVRIMPLFLKVEDGLTNEASKRDFCAFSMKQIINRMLSPKLMSEGLFQLVVKDNYGALGFKGNEEVTNIWSSDKSCKLLLKTDDGMRSFDFYLNQSSDFKFYYQIQKITENELFEKEENR